MTAPISIQEMLRFILYLLGIGALGYLIVILKNVAEIFKKFKYVLDESEEDLIETIDEIPKITKNVSSITKTTDDALTAMAPEIDGIIHSANNVTGKIDSITTVLDNATYKVGETVDDVTDSISDTAYNFSKSMGNITYYMSILNEIIEIFKNVFFNR